MLYDLIIIGGGPAGITAGIYAGPGSMDLNLARELNRRLYDFLGKEDIVMDLTTAALGYGLDYAFTNMERARLRV